MGSPFKCPKCNKEMHRVGVSEAWSGGGAELFYCSSCNKYYWWIQCFVDIPNSSFYEEVGSNLKQAVIFSPYQLCKKLCEDVDLEYPQTSKPKSKMTLNYYMWIQH